MFYATNKLRHSAYHIRLRAGITMLIALLLLSLSVLHLFSYPLKRG